MFFFVHLLFIKFGKVRHNSFPIYRVVLWCILTLEIYLTLFFFVSSVLSRLIPSCCSFFSILYTSLFTINLLYIINALYPLLLASFSCGNSAFLYSCRFVGFINPYFCTLKILDVFQYPWFLMTILQLLYLYLLFHLRGVSKVPERSELRIESKNKKHLFYI